MNAGRAVGEDRIAGDQREGARWREGPRELRLEWPIIREFAVLAADAEADQIIERKQHGGSALDEREH